MKLTLEAPSVERMDSYRSMVAEFLSSGEKLVPFIMRIPAGDSQAFIRRLENCAKGIGISDWFVPHETYFLVANDCEVVGVSNLRLCLTDSLRKDGGHIGIGIRPSWRKLGLATVLILETMKMARCHQISRVLLTCDLGNIGSQKAILKAGGKIETDGVSQDDGKNILKYWINVPDA